MSKQILLAHVVDRPSELVVIKVIRDHMRAENLEAVRRRCELKRVFSHPNLVDLIDEFSEPDVRALVLEYVSGLSLIQLMRRCAQRRVPFPSECALHIVAELIKGISASHRAMGVATQAPWPRHDLAFEKILIGRDGSVRLSDFGEVMSGTPIFAVGYASPEELECEPFDERRDVFVVGIVLFELLSGRRLFGVQSLETTLEKNANVQIDIPLDVIRPDLEPELIQIVDTCLEARPSERFRSLAELRRELGAYIFSRGATEGRPLLEAMVEKVSPEES